MKIIERLRLYIDYKQISFNSFDKAIGASNGYIGKQIKNGASIGGDIIEKISCIYPDLNIEWLVTGRGEMLISDEEQMRKTLEKSEPHLFNINLKYLREQQEWSALQVSKKLDLAWATYSAYETATWPRPETLVKISEMYNVTIDDLVKKNLQTSPKTELNNNSRIQDLTDIIKSKDEIIALQKELLQELKNKKQTKKLAGIEVEEKH